MTFKGNDYLVVVDCYANYPEIALLENKTAECVINHLKSMFARHGIAEFFLASRRSNLPVMVFARPRSSCAKCSVVSGPVTSSEVIAASSASISIVGGGQYGVVSWA